MMKLLHFIYEIADSEEEFLAIIKELNKWVEGNENENRSIYVPNNVGRCGFTRAE